MKKLIGSCVLLIFITSCGIFKTVTSNTNISPQNSFELGNNEHGSFTVILKNVSENDVVLHRAPITGGTHSYMTVKSKESVRVIVESNTALVIENKSNDTASIDLHITGDTGLSMGYKNN